MAIDQRKFTSALRMMSDQQLQQTAQLHQNDPYIFPLAFQESQERKALRSGMMAEDKGGGTPPPIKDQALMAMAPQATPDMGAQPLPENVGIGALPMQSNTYAGGGIVAFAGGGKSSVGSYEEQIRAEAVRQGVDPDLMVRMFATESAGKPGAVSPKGAAGLGQLMIPAAAEMGLSPEERFDPNKNIPASVGYFKKQLSAFENDPAKAAAAYNWGPGSMRKHLAKNPEDWKLGLPKETANYLTKLMPVGTAQAAPAGGDNVSQIPAGSSYGATTPAARDDRSYFGKLADTAGIPEEYQRNISNTLSALGGFSMPTAWASKAANLASKGLEPTAEAVEKASRLKQIAETPRLMPPAKAGLEGLDEASKAARAAAVAGRQARGLEADVQAAKGAQQSVDAATKTAQIAREAEAAMRAKNAATGINAAKVANVGRGVTGMQAMDQALRGDEAGGMEPAPPMAKENFRKLERAASAPPTDITPKEAIAAAKATMTPEERKESGFSAEDWLTLGFALLSGKSPYALQNLGEAGAAMLAGKTARTKAGLEALKTKQEIELSKAHQKYYGSAAERMEEENKPLAQMRKELAAIDAELQKNMMLGMDPLELARVKKERYAAIAQRYPDLAGTIGLGTAAGVVVPQGVNVTRIG